MDSTRIMLNSRSERHANGIGNGSDQLGRNFCEQIMLHIQDVLPHLFGRGYQNDDGIGGGQYYIPRFNHRSRQDYLRGFGIQMWTTGCDVTDVPVACNTPGFGAGFKAEAKNRYPALDL